MPLQSGKKTLTESIIVIIHQGREDIFLSRGIKKRGLKLSSLPWCIYV
jgi:hypothetical protein